MHCDNDCSHLFKMTPSDLPSEVEQHVAKVVDLDGAGGNSRRGGCCCMDLWVSITFVTYTYLPTSLHTPRIYLPPDQAFRAIYYQGSTSN